MKDLTEKEKEKYTSLLDLMCNNWGDFLLIVKEKNLNDLDYKILLQLLDDSEVTIRKDARDGICILLAKIPTENLDRDEVESFLNYRRWNVEEGVHILLRNINCHRSNKKPRGADYEKVLALLE